MVTIAEEVTLRALPGLPVVESGADVGTLIWTGLERADIALADGDVLVVTSKILSRAAGRFVDLGTVIPGPEARELAERVDKDARLVELVLRESVAVSRAVRGVLIVRHRLGFVSANAAIDQSNARPAHAGPESGPWALLMPEDPDADARRLRADLEARSGVALGVIVTDSLGRPFRTGSLGTAVGVAGIPAVLDLRGQDDLFGRPLEHTSTGLADQIAAAADLVAGQSGEGRGVVHVRGVIFTEDVRARWGADDERGARALIWPVAGDLYA